MIWRVVFKSQLEQPPVEIEADGLVVESGALTFYRHDPQHPFSAQPSRIFCSGSWREVEAIDLGEGG